ncbi:MAG: thioredoxin domain-containing protein, partial [Firmicutes bacterium]|nr:thioredoxin domain-containing protein [Bacillota bacterium]
RMSPVLADIEEDYADNLKVVKININFDGELAERYDVQAVPTLIFFKNGAEAARLVGLVKKSDIEAIINTL